jgi:hypothetical protein
VPSRAARADLHAGLEALPRLRRGKADGLPTAAGDERERGQPSVFRPGCSYERPPLAETRPISFPNAHHAQEDGVAAAAAEADVASRHCARSPQSISARTAGATAGSVDGRRR